MIANDVVVTILTGGRPSLLADTLESVRRHADGLLDTALVIALNNGGDTQTGRVLSRHDDVIDRMFTTKQMLPIGPAVSQLAHRVVRSGKPWWLHLEDDWRCHPCGDWLDATRMIFEVSPRVSQVRLRLADEPVLSRHMVTREKLRWREMDWFRLSPDAHYTLNPSLVRTSDVEDAWPAEGERAAQRRWRKAGHREVAQLVPGVFAHTGKTSLRRTTGSPT